MRGFVLLFLMATAGCGSASKSSDNSTNDRIARECEVPVAEVKRVKTEALNWKSLEMRSLGQCKVVRGDDGDDVFIQRSDGTYLDDMGRPEKAGS